MIAGRGVLHATDEGRPLAPHAHRCERGAERRQLRQRAAEECRGGGGAQQRRQPVAQPEHGSDICLWFRRAVFHRDGGSVCFLPNREYHSRLRQRTFANCITNVRQRTQEPAQRALMSESALPSDPPGNRLLAALPRQDYERLLPSLEIVSLGIKEVVYEPHGPLA